MEITFNTKFLYKLRPERMVLIAILMLLVMLILAPIQINNTLDFSSVVYIVSSLLAFLLGTKMIRTRAKRQQLTIQVNIPKLTKIYNLTFWLGFIGVVFRYYDLFSFAAYLWQVLPWKTWRWQPKRAVTYFQLLQVC